jgi:Pyruvate/2-oxoacid:ferredoxin oxidoreductase gamma subunit
MAFNEPSLRKFVGAVQPGGWILYNGTALPEDATRKDVNWIVHPFTEIADGVGDPRAGNIVMLGALLEATGVLAEARIDSALRRLVKTQRWLDLDRTALAKGREAFRAQEVVS